jgi:hypothetical protein
LGVVLATQNPVDLDYKGLSNAGTWFIGRLQTEKDKERLAEGLIRGGVSAKFDKQTLMNAISSLNKREFLLHNVHEEEAQFFNTRWVLSYLCGPLTRAQIKLLMKDRKEKSKEIAPKTRHKTRKQTTLSESEGEPQLPATIRRYYAPANKKINNPGKIIYHLYVMANADVAFFNSRYGLAQNVELAYALPCAELKQDISWGNSNIFTFNPDIITDERIDDARYLPLPSEATRLSTYEKLDKQFETHIYQNYSIVLWQNKLLKVNSHHGESKRDFRVRIMQVAHERRDLELDRLKRAYTKKINALEKRLSTTRRLVEKESDQYQQKMLDTAISVGSTLFDVFLGGRGSRRTVSRTARSATRLGKEKRDISRAKEKMTQIEAQIKELENQLQQEINQISRKFDLTDEHLKKVVIRPKKSDILQKYFGLVWVPFFHGDDGNIVSLNSNLSINFLNPS